MVAIHLEATEVPAGLRLVLNNRQAIIKHELAEEEFHKRLMRAAQGAFSPAAAPTSASVQTTPHPMAGVVLAAVALFAVAVGIWWLHTLDAAPEGTEPAIVGQTEPASTRVVLPNSIAVLPFANLSPNPEDAYFAAGIHEEVISQLVGIRDLSVISRTSVMQYADRRIPVEDIARDLGVSTVMEGSVRFAGNRVRITAQLIDGQSGANIWSKAYEDRLEDIFGIQLAIATQIARTLEAQFSPSERAKIGRRSTDSPEAYAHYLRAVAGFGNYAPLGPLHEALDAAITLDPQFAAALAFKAFVHSIESTAGFSFFPNYDAQSQRHYGDLARDYAQRALEIDDSQARAHYAMQWVHTVNREWAASQQSAASAYQANPNDYIVLNGAGWAALARGETELGIEYLERSVALAPNDFAARGNFADFLAYAQRWDYAKEQAEFVTTLAPNFTGAYSRLAEAYSHIGDVQAVRNVANTMEAMSATPIDLARLSRSYARIGDTENAIRIVEKLRKSYSQQSLAVYLATGDREGAINLISRALKGGFPWMVGRDLHYHSNHPFFDPIRSHPEFDELRQRAALPLE